MREPNFSESQLQQATNTAFIRKVLAHHGYWAFAHVPSLIAEYDLGWDTGFHLHWLPHAPSSEDEGCNFFLQYKLSGELTSKGAKEWSHWKDDYFRFKIPHSSRNDVGDFVDDYHQWHRLKALANKNYPTFYATNSTLRKSVLQTTLEAGNLLDHVPLLDIRTVANEHKHVTFTSTSNAFALHSEIEVVKKQEFSTVLRLLADQAQTSLRESTDNLLNVLKAMDENDERWHQDLSRWPSSSNLPEYIQPWLKQAFLASFVRKHVGAVLLWYPKTA